MRLPVAPPDWLRKLENFVSRHQRKRRRCAIFIIRTKSIQEILIVEKPCIRHNVLDAATSLHTQKPDRQNQASKVGPVAVRSLQTEPFLFYTGAMKSEKHISAIVAGALCILFLCIRARGSLFSPQFWAEDGVIFWYQQASLGSLAVLKPYAGYFIITPRIIAAISSFFDPSLAPRYFVFGCLVATFWAAYTAADAVDNRMLGVALAVGLMLPPVGSGEVFMNITNLQWLMAPTLALLCVSKNVSSNQRIYAAIAGMTGPFSAILLPVSFYRVVRHCDMLSATLTICGLFQLACIILTGTVPMPKGQGTISGLIGVMAFRPFLYRSLCAGLGVLVIVASFQPQMRSLRMAALWLGLAILVSTTFRFVPNPSSLDNEAAGARYFYVPRVALIWCALSIATIGWKNAALATAFIGSLVLAGPEYLIRPPLPDAHWSEQYNSGARSVAISPPGWNVPIPGR